MKPKNIQGIRKMGPTHQRSSNARIKSNVRSARLIYNKLIFITDSKTASSVAVDLADIAAIGQRHNDRIQELLHLDFPRDLKKADSLIARFEVDLLWENQRHLRSLKRELPKLLRSLNGYIRAGQKR